MRCTLLATFAYSQPIFVYQVRAANLLATQVTKTRPFPACAILVNLVAVLGHRTSADLISLWAPSPRSPPLLEPRLEIVPGSSCAILSTKQPGQPVTALPEARRIAHPIYQTVHLLRPVQR